MLEKYKVVFDIGANPTAFDLSTIAIFLLPVIGLALVIIPQSKIDRILTRGPKGAAGKIFGWFFFLTTSFIAITSIVGFFLL